jgi:hypothetical protein
LEREQVLRIDEELSRSSASGFRPSGKVTDEFPDARSSTQAAGSKEEKRP